MRFTSYTTYYAEMFFRTIIIDADVDKMKKSDILIIRLAEDNLIFMASN